MANSGGLSEPRERVWVKLRACCGVPDSNDCAACRAALDAFEAAVRADESVIWHKVLGSGVAAHGEPST